MTFAQFCAAHGLIIRGGIRTTHGKLAIRVPTTCAPSELKGWYRYSATPGLDGKLRGVCGIWHGTDNGAQQWVQGDDQAIKPLTEADFKRIAEQQRRAEDDMRQKQHAAAIRAQGLLNRSEMRSHAYLARKGFPDLLVPTINDGETLLVSMWDGKRVANLQMIAGKLPETPEEKARQKLFLPAKWDGLVLRHQIGSVGTAINCEGYCTGLSVAAAIKASKMRAHCVIWFTAGNMAANARTGVVVADNDKSLTGEKAAQATGLRYFMPPEVGQDFNDYHRAHGLFAASQRIRELLLTP